MFSNNVVAPVPNHVRTRGPTKWWVRVSSKSSSQLMIRLATIQDEKREGPTRGMMIGAVTTDAMIAGTIEGMTEEAAMKGAAMMDAVMMVVPITRDYLVVVMIVIAIT